MVENSTASGAANSQVSKKVIEVQVPISLVRTRNKLNKDGNIEK
jgi:hypothetical protein